MGQQFRQDDPRLLAHVDDVIDSLDDDIAFPIENSLGQGKQPVFADEAE